MPQDPALALLHIRRPPRGVQVVQGRELLLDVHADTQLGRRPHDHADLSGVHPGVHGLALGVGVVVVNDRDLVRGNTLGDELPLDLLEGVEPLVIRDLRLDLPAPLVLDGVPQLVVRIFGAGGLEEVREHDLREPEFLVVLPPLVNLADRPVELRSRVVRLGGVHQAKVEGRFACQARDDQGLGRVFLLLLARQLVPCAVALDKVLHESRELVGPLEFDRLRPAALEVRPWQVRHFGGDVVAPLLPNLHQLLHVAELGKPGIDLPLAHRRHFQLGHRLSERGRELVEVRDSAGVEQVRADVPEHRPRLGKRVGDRRSREHDHVLAAGAVLHEPGLHVHTQPALAEPRVQSLDRVHRGHELQLLVLVGLVHEQSIHAQIVEVENVVPLAVEQLLEGLLQLFDGPLHLLDGRVFLPLGPGSRLLLGDQGVDLRLHERLDPVRVVGNAIELALRDDDGVVVARGDAAEQALAVLGLEVVLGRVQDARRGIEQLEVVDDLAGGRVLRDQHHLLGLPEPAPLHRRRNHDERLAGAHRVRVQVALRDTADDRPHLVGPESNVGAGSGELLDAGKVPDPWHRCVVDLVVTVLELRGEGTGLGPLLEVLGEFLLRGLRREGPLLVLDLLRALAVLSGDGVVGDRHLVIERKLNDLACVEAASGVGRVVRPVGREALVRDAHRELTDGRDVLDARPGRLPHDLVDPGLVDLAGDPRRSERHTDLAQRHRLGLDRFQSLDVRLVLRVQGRGFLGRFQLVLDPAAQVLALGPQSAGVGVAEREAFGQERRLHIGRGRFEHPGHVFGVDLARPREAHPERVGRGLRGVRRRAGEQRPLGEDRRLGVGIAGAGRFFAIFELDRVGMLLLDLEGGHEPELRVFTQES